MIKVSVVVPVYNSERHLRQCLESLVGQTLHEIEIIAVNDASTDSSPAILNEYQGRHGGRFTVIDSPENRNAGGARNLGIAAAQGEYLAFVDSDDWLDPTALEMLYTEALQRDADLVACDYYVFYGNDEPLNRRQGWAESLIGAATRAVRDERIAQQATGALWAKLIRRSIFTEHHLLLPENTTSEDAIVPYLWSLVAYAAKVPYPLYYYRSDNESTVRARNRAHHFDRMRVALTMLDHFKRSGTYAQHRDAVDFAFIRNYYMSMLPILLFRFDNPPRDKLEEARAYMRDHYPRYRSGPFYSRLSRFQRALALLNDISPVLAIWTAKIAQTHFPSLVPRDFRRPRGDSNMVSMVSGEPDM